tara:strand:+ start:717 stop:950 length:234 start_codon:yes stop_codon:yes gene_type:complete
MVITPIPNWRGNKWIRYMLKAHLPKEGVPIEVSERSQPANGIQEATKYAVVIYKLGDKLYRTELKLRNDRTRWSKEK